MQYQKFFLKLIIGSHLCCNYREIASVAAEHEELTKYAHEYSIELLKNLEEKKKKLFKDNTCVNQTSEGHDVVLDEMPKASGVKRKATVGRPRGSGSRCSRFKGVLEGKKHISQAESYVSTYPVRKSPAKNQIFFFQVIVFDIFDEWIKQECMFCYIFFSFIANFF